jgi:hypothetical protein
MNMSHELKEEMLPKLQARYARRSREGKSAMLNELGEDYGYERKYLIKLLRDSRPSTPRLPRFGPEPRYGLIEPIVRQMWLASEQPCGKRLVPILEQWLPYYERRFGRVSHRQRLLLRQVSAATLDRLLATARTQSPGRGRCGTKPGSLLRTEIPIRTGTWDLARPGYLEADSVAHCGASLAGDFIWSLTYTDIFSGWTEGRAVWNKGAAGVLAATKDVEAGLPFPLLGFDCDNGSEFLNHHLWGYMTQRHAPVEFTRSRAYHKNDQAHVEQKNWMWPRQLLGYGRLEDDALVARIHAVYKEVWGPLHNFFLPCFKLQSKWREGSHWRKRYEPPRTACDRLCGPGLLSRQVRSHLRERQASLDPFQLQDQLELRLQQILRVQPVGGSTALGVGPPLHPPKPAPGLPPQGRASEGSPLAPLLDLARRPEPKLLPCQSDRNTSQPSPACSDPFGVFFP